MKKQLMRYGLLGSLLAIVMFSSTAFAVVFVPGSSSG